jgi:hypothetical protein
VGTCPTIEIVGLGLKRRVATGGGVCGERPTIEIVRLGLKRRVATGEVVFCGERLTIEIVGLGLKRRVATGELGSRSGSEKLVHGALPLWLMREAESLPAFTSHQSTGFFCL